MEPRPAPEVRPLPDYYKVLRVDPAAEPEVVEAVYLALARRYVLAADPGAAERLAQICAAYAVLGDPRRRALYDLVRVLDRRVALAGLNLTPSPSPRPGIGDGGRGLGARPSPPPVPYPPSPIGERGAEGGVRVGAEPNPPALLPSPSAQSLPQVQREDGLYPPGEEGGVLTPTLPQMAREQVASGSVPSIFAESPSDRLFRLARAHPQASAVAALVVLSLIVRLVALNTVPANLTADESDNLQVVYHILAGRGAPSLFGLDWKPAPAFSVYLMAAFMQVFGWSIAGMRMASVLLSSLTIIPFYLVAREKLSPAASLASAFLLSTGLWFLHFSRSGWENAQVGLFTMLAAWGLIRGLEGRGLRWYALAGLGSALGLYGYFSGRFIVVSLLAYLPFALWERRGRARQVLIGYAVMLLVCAAIFAPEVPTIVNRWEFFNGRTRTVAITSAQLPYLGARTMPELVLGQVGRTVRAFVLLDGTAVNNARYFPVGRPIFDPLTGTLFLIGLVTAAVAWRRTALWWCLAAVPIGLTQVLSMGTPDLARAVGVAPALYLFVGYGFDRLAPRPGSGRRALQLGALLLLPWASFQNVSGYATWMARPDTISTRGPAIDASEFALWQSLQYKAAVAGEWGFTAGQWEDMRKSLGLPDQPGAQPVGQPVPKPQPARPPASRTANLPNLGVFRAALGVGVLQEPRGVAADGSEAIYALDAAKRQVVKLDAEGQPVLSWGKEGRGPGEFLVPWDVAVDASGRVYVLDSDVQVVQRFDAQGKLEARLLEQAGFYRPRGLAVDAQGALYVADTGRNRVVKASPNGEIVAVYGGGGTDLALEQPTGVAADSDGNVYVVEPAAKRMRKLSPAGRVISEWDVPSSDTLNAPHLAVSGGRLFVTEPSTQRVVVYSLDGTPVGFVGTPGIGDGQLALPMGVAVDANGQIYVGDVKGGRVLRFALKE